MSVFSRRRKIYDRKRALRKGKRQACSCGNDGILRLTKHSDIKIPTSVNTARKRRTANIKQENMIYIPLETLKEGDVFGVKEKLVSAENFNKIIVNAVCYKDLAVFCEGLNMGSERGEKLHDKKRCGSA